MDFLEEIRHLSDEELKKKVYDKIAKLEEQSNEDNNNSKEIGYLIDNNPHCYDLINTDKEIHSVGIRCIYNGYIPKGMKINYGIECNLISGLFSNNGWYYIVDDDSYLYDFCKYIKDKDIVNEYEFFEYALNFMRSYFGNIKHFDRDDMLKKIYKNIDTMAGYNQIQERKLSWFKGQGNAMCTEYSILAQNILSLFGMDTYIVFGIEHTEGKTEQDHTYQFISYIDNETKEKVNALIDFSNSVKIYDMNFNKVGVSPFMSYIDELNEDFFMSFLETDHLIIEDYDYYVFGNETMVLKYDRKRDYYMGVRLATDKSVNICKKTK